MTLFDHENDSITITGKRRGPLRQWRGHYRIIHDRTRLLVEFECTHETYDDEFAKALKRLEEMVPHGYDYGGVQ